MTLNIREASEQDLQCLMAIETASQSHPWSGAVMARYLKHPRAVWIAEAAGKAVGFAVVTQIVGEAELLDIAIHPESQGRGYGEQLLTFLLDLVQTGGCERMFLEVRRSNDGAIYLYEKLGFCQVGVRKDYYPSRKGREDALLYCQEILD